MRQFSLVAGGPSPAAGAQPRRQAGLLLDVAMTVVMLALTSVFVGTLALSMS